MKIKKIFLPDPPPHLPPGIRPGGCLDGARWLWHPEVHTNRPVFLQFKIRFEVGVNEPDLILHFSADQYAELSCDNVHVARGPEAAPIEAYSFSSFRISGFVAGHHELNVFAWWLGTEPLTAPLARETNGPGFILAAEGAYADRLSTGTARWRVCHLAGWQMDPTLGFGPAFGVGGGVEMDTRIKPSPYVIARPSRPPFRGNEYGSRDPCYRLYPARLPEQLRDPVAPGRVRAVYRKWIAGWGERGSPFIFPEEKPKDPEGLRWNHFWRGDQELVLDPDTCVAVLVDLETYLCGFPEWTFSGGRDAVLQVLWAESLEQPVSDANAPQKGHRDEIVGKCIRGIQDRLIANGKRRQTLRPHWWRAGRYLLIRIRVGRTPLTLHRFRIIATRYPLAITGRFSCDQDAVLEPVKALSLRGLQMCMHETYMDCPYYEQLMYVFDTRLEVLTTYALSHDDRLPRRAIELFDFSRRRFDGFTCSRFPCVDDQLIPLFSLAWTWMIRDHLYWRGNANWLRQFMLGVREVHERFESLKTAGSLIGPVPGWNYGDWVAAWPGGALPQSPDGVSCILNLAYLYSLRQLADLETQLGDPSRARLYADRAQQLGAAIHARFWRADAGLLADDDSGRCWSQHAQIWGILSGLLKGRQARRAIRQALQRPGIQPASYMMRSLWFDVLHACGLGGWILPALDAWREMASLGAHTGFECQEPTRSDCHAWSSHPLFHLPASVLGIRPVAAGFERVQIAPQPGTLKHLSARMPHPRGHITADLEFKGSRCQGHIRLPPDITGTFLWKGKAYPLRDATTFKGVPA